LFAGRLIRASEKAEVSAPRSAEILFKDVPAGHLQETPDGGTRFVYAPGWAQPIACCLPVIRREHAWPQGLHPFFQHLGPEGWLRERQARSAHLAEEDDLGLLLRYGADCIGAVSVRGPDPAAADLPADGPVNPGRTISGVQRKLLVVRRGAIFDPAGAAGPAPYIAKFNSDAVPTLVRNEALSLRWAAAVLGAREVCAFRLGQVTGVNEVALVLTRFDRAPDGTKLRLEDFAQILCKPRGPDGAGKYDADHEEAAAVIRTQSARPEIDLDKLFRRLIVFALLGNCDGHLKNFSLLETPDGLRLAPLYDVLNTALYPEYDRTLALRIAGKRVALDAVTPTLLEELGHAIGLPGRAIALAFADLRRGVRRAASALVPPAGEPPDGFIHRYAEVVRAGCLRILRA